MSENPPVLVTMRRYVDALLAGDWEALAGTLADDHVFEDRRLAMGNTLDKAGNIAQAQVLAELGKDQPFEVDLDVIETRGDRSALVRQVYRSGDYAIRLLAVIQVNDAGRTTTFTVFDEDDVNAARAELAQHQPL